jgi:hypothetical protein
VQTLVQLLKLSVVADEVGRRGEALEILDRQRRLPIGVRERPVRFAPGATRETLSAAMRGIRIHWTWKSRRIARTCRVRSQRDSRSARSVE